MYSTPLIAVAFFYLFRKKVEKKFGVIAKTPYLCKRNYKSNALRLPGSTE